MSGLATSQWIAAPRQQVWDRATDIEAWPSTIPAILSTEILEGDGMAVGTRFTETRRMMKKEATETMEVVALDPGRSYDLEAFNCGCRYLTRVSFEDETRDGREGTLMTFDFTAEPLSFWARVFSAIMTPLMKGMLRKCLVEDLAAMRDACEGDAHSGPGQADVAPA